jgi:hypothetical protein
MHTTGEAHPMRRARILTTSGVKNFFEKPLREINRATRKESARERALYRKHAETGRFHEKIGQAIFLMGNFFE